MGLIMRPAQPASASYPMKRDREGMLTSYRVHALTDALVILIIG